MRRLPPMSLAVGLVSLACLVGCGGDDVPASPPIDADAGDGAPKIDPSTFAEVPASCAFSCDCSAEVAKPYACPNLGAWGEIAHADSCAAWDGKYPSPAKGQCTASLPTGEAMRYAGPDADHPGTLVLPDGRRISPAGKEWLFSEKALHGGLPSNVVPIPGLTAGKSWVLTIDTGYGPHVVRVVDAAKIGDSDPTLGFVQFDQPSTLNSGVAFVAPDLVYVATADGVVQALKLDRVTGKIARDDGRSLKLPPSKSPTGSTIGWYLSGVAATTDGKHLVASAVRERKLLVFDVEAGSTTFGKQVGAVDVGAGETFGVWLDPHDASSRYAYVSLWASRAVVEVDLGDPAAPRVARTFATDKNPQGIAFLDARWMAVANDHGDTIALVDRVSGSVTEIPVDIGALHGSEPSMLAYDETSRRLYATLAGINAVGAWDVDLSSTPPTIVPVGRLPTAWWPGGVAVLEGGALAVVNLRGHATGPNLNVYLLSDGGIMDNIRGSIQRIDFPTAADLVAGEAAVKLNGEVRALAGAPTVSCPDGVHDFPVPPTNTEGPSKVIDHVIFIVRENKGFDGVLGDLPGANGQADLLFKPPAEMDRIWLNFRKLVQTFSTSDNYYTSAELSIQGHVWTTTGRSNDYVERTWAMDGDGRDPRHIPFPEANTTEVAKPEEGSVFDWLTAQGVPYGIFGEAAGLPRRKEGSVSSVDNSYPGGLVQSIGYPDNEKACYLAGRLRVLCDLPRFVYATMPNDHTNGLGSGRVTPEVMIATNDEATGMLIDALSHSPQWATSLVIVIEDDPTQGGDHIENHRSPMLVVSPWVKRGYVSKTHIDISSMHK
ncbi:MAG: alkaline phosphatase family protein, partial [Polyangiales bacterium]